MDGELAGGVHEPHLDATKEGPERTGITEIKHIMGLYRFWDELRSRHPGLVIDNCSSGGRRFHEAPENIGRNAL